MKPNKVVITITAHGRSVELFENDKTLSKREHKQLSPGESHALQKGDYYDDLDEEFHDLAEAIEDADFGCFDVSSQLYLIEEEYYVNEFEI